MTTANDEPEDSEAQTAQLEIRGVGVCTPPPEPKES